MKHKVKRFIHISTDEVYGPIVASDDATEDYPLNPTSPYSASKASADLLLQSYYKTYNFPVIIVRPCNNYGPNQYPEKLIPMTITRLFNGDKVLLHGEGKEIREWLYVDDCVKIIERIMECGEIGEIYNVGSGDRKTNFEVIGYIVDHLYGGVGLFSEGGGRIMPDPQEYIEFIPNRPGNDFRYAINTSKLISKPWADGISYTSFEDGINSTIQWYRDNCNFWKNIDMNCNIYKENDDYLR